MKKVREKILDLLVGVFKSDEQIHSIFITGSMNYKTSTTPLSDIDLWIILYEESGINAIRKQLEDIFSKVSPVRMMYQCTAHHYFIIFKNGVQVDFNMATAACYYSLINPHKKILADSRRSHEKKTITTAAKHKAFVADQLLIGYTTLERAISKFLKGDYVVTIRFLDGIRSNVIFSLLPFVENVEIPNVVTVPLDKLSKNVKESVVASYAQPTKESCKSSINAIMTLMELITKKTKSRGVQDIHKKLSTILLHV